jgi:DUF1365 family protein
MALAPPGETLRLQIDSKLKNALVVHSLVSGRVVPLTDLGMARRFLSHPLITVAILAKIHYQALRLFLKKVPYLRKSDRTELQKGGLA